MFDFLGGIANTVTSWLSPDGAPGAYSNGGASSSGASSGSYGSRDSLRDLYGATGLSTAGMSASTTANVAGPSGTDAVRGAADTVSSFTPWGMFGEFFEGLIHGDEAVQRDAREDRALEAVAKEGRDAGSLDILEGMADLPVVGDVVGKAVKIPKTARKIANGATKLGSTVAGAAGDVFDYIF